MPDDLTTGKMQHREICIDPFFPADQHASIAIEPAMRPFHHPAPRLRFFTLGLALIAKPANPRHHADLSDIVMDAASDIAPIEAQPRAWHRRPFDNDMRERFSSSMLSCR